MLTMKAELRELFADFEGQEWKIFGVFRQKPVDKLTSLFFIQLGIQLFTIPPIFLSISFFLITSPFFCWVMYANETDYLDDLRECAEMAKAPVHLNKIIFLLKN